MEQLPTAMPCAGSAKSMPQNGPESICSLRCVTQVAPPSSVLIMFRPLPDGALPAAQPCSASWNLYVYVHVPAGTVCDCHVRPPSVVRSARFSVRNQPSLKLMKYPPWVVAQTLHVRPPSVVRNTPPPPEATPFRLSKNCTRPTLNGIATNDQVRP